MQPVRQDWHLLESKASVWCGGKHTRERLALAQGEHEHRGATMMSRLYEYKHAITIQ